MEEGRGNKMEDVRRKRQLTVDNVCRSESIVQASLTLHPLNRIFHFFLSLPSYYIYAVLAEIYNGGPLNVLNHSEKLYSGE